MVIGRFISELTQWGLQTVSLMCGQGLVEHVDHLDSQLKAGDTDGGSWEPVEGVLVYASSATHASEASGGAPALGDPAAIEAMMRRLLGE